MANEQSTEDHVNNRYHGVFAPNSFHRARVTPAKRVKGSQPGWSDESRRQTLAEHQAAMTWAQRLKRVFDTDIETGSKCAGAVKVIARIEHPVVIEDTHPPE